MHKPDGDSLGLCIEQRRRELDLSLSSLALASGASKQTLSAWLTDTALPTADDVGRLCRSLKMSPLCLLPRITETARRLLRRALADAARLEGMLTARSSDGAVDEAERQLVENLPWPLRSQLAAEWHCTAHDLPALAKGLRHLASESAERQDVMVRGLAAELKLVGEDELPHFELKNLGGPRGKY